MIDDVVAEIWINRSRAVADQRRHMMRIAGCGGFDNDIGITAQPGVGQAVMDRACCQQGMYWQQAFGKAEIRQHNQHLAFAHARSHRSHQITNRLS